MTTFKKGQKFQHNLMNMVFEVVAVRKGKFKAIPTTVTDFVNRRAYNTGVKTVEMWAYVAKDEICSYADGEGSVLVDGKRQKFLWFFLDENTLEQNLIDGVFTIV